MGALTPIFVTGYRDGLMKNKKPMLLPEDAWQTLENGYVWRERVLKREGLKLLGRLQRDISGGTLPDSQASPWTVDLFTSIGLSGFITAATQANPCQITSEDHNLVNGDQILITGVVGMTQLNGNTYTVTVVDPDNFIIGVDSTLYTAYVSGGFWTNISETHPQIVPGSVTITVGAIVFTDNGNGTLSSVTLGNSGYINYNTGIAVLTHTAGAGASSSVSFSYYPSLPVIGIPTRDIATINAEQTIWFDEKYAYAWTGTEFAEFIPGMTWNSSDSDFFWWFNYRGAADSTRLLFVTNFVNTADNPMRYTNGSAWTDFKPIIADNPPSVAQSVIYSARIIVAYYNRLLLLNTWEGLTAGGNAGAANFFNRCRFSQVGSPIASDAWRGDQFGKGGLIDAPTNEAIISATFVRSVLVVTFEQSTWILRYVGEYGTPFMWERVSSDLGSESPFSSVLFDNYMFAIGDKAIIAANPNSVERVDLDLPDQVFEFKNSNDGTKRIFGIRNYQKELIYWNYADSNTNGDVIFPNRVLLYNYRNKTWAIFRDNITAFGTFQNPNNLTWDSQSVTWDSDEVTWDDAQNQSLFPSIVSGNQQGFINLYQEDEGVISVSPMQEQPSLSITGVNLNSPVQLTIINHNLEPNEIIYLTGLMFIDGSTHLPVSTNLNNQFYQVGIVDVDTITISLWNGTAYENNFPVQPATSAIYVGGGLVTLIPKLNIVSGDINIYQKNSLQTKLSRLDFLMQPTNGAGMTVNLFVNASFVSQGNVLVGNTGISTDLTQPFYYPGSDYSWFRFYATTYGQYFNINVTYDDSLMNQTVTHTEPWTMYAINALVRPGGKNVF